MTRQESIEATAKEEVRQYYERRNRNRRESFCEVIGYAEQLADAQSYAGFDDVTEDEMAVALWAELDDVISAAFQDAAFEDHPPGAALDSAREDASRLVPHDVTGAFDDEHLTFTAGSASSRRRL